jgi:trans-aconitate 2-methyltransferase
VDANGCFNPAEAAPPCSTRKRDLCCLLQGALAIVTTDWDPDLYNRFQRYRAEPFELILERLPLTPDDRIIDLGCGTGENTIALARRAANGYVVGLDSSAAMIACADRLRCTLEPDLQGRLHFVQGDFRTLLGEGEYSIVVSNAALQWAGNHREVVARWVAALRPGGRMVVQMPANHAETAQATLAQIVREPRWSSFAGDLRIPPHPLGTPDSYRALLGELGMIEIDCYYHSFRHRMENPAAIVEFCRATAMRPVLERIPLERHDEFVAEFTSRLEAAYGTRGPLIFPFRRLFLWARRVGN